MNPEQQISHTTLEVTELPLPRRDWTNLLNVGANDDHMVVRGDYHATSNSRLSGRYTRGRPDLLTPRFSAANPRTFTGFDDAVSASVFHFRPALSSETRFGFKRNDVERLDGIFTLAIPTITGLGFSGNGGELLVSKGKGWSFEEVIAFNKGRHSVKFGGIFQFQNQSRNNAEVPEFTYASVGDFLADIPSTIQVTFGLRPYLIKEWSSGYFIQDDFKVRANLVLNLGLRYDYYSVPTERDGRLLNRDGLFGYGPLRSPDSIQEADRNNFAPRVGFAWSMDASGKTVLRGGSEPRAWVTTRLRYGVRRLVGCDSVGGSDSFSSRAKAATSRISRRTPKLA